MNRNSGANSLKTLKNLVMKLTRDSTTNRITIDTDSILGYLRQQINFDNSSGQARVFGATIANVSFDEVASKQDSIWEYAIINLECQRRVRIPNRT